MKLSWLKLDVDILDDEKIRILRSNPIGDSIFVVWVGILCLAMKSRRPGVLLIGDEIAYDEETLASRLSIPVQTVRASIQQFIRFKMIDITPEGEISVINFAKHQNLDQIEYRKEQGRIRAERYRQKRNAQLTAESNALLTRTERMTNDIKIREEKEREREKEREKNSYDAGASDESRAKSALADYHASKRQKRPQTRPTGQAVSIVESDPQNAPTPAHAPHTAFGHDFLAAYTDRFKAATGSAPAIDYGRVGKTAKTQLYAAKIAPEEIGPMLDAYFSDKWWRGHFFPVSGFLAHLDKWRLLAQGARPAPVAVSESPDEAFPW